jgi:hypothetical protein
MKSRQRNKANLNLPASRKSTRTHQGLKLMTENPARLADRIDQTGHQLLNAGQKLREGVITAAELRTISEALGILSEVAHLHASKLSILSTSGRHAPRESPGDPQPGA